LVADGAGKVSTILQEGKSAVRCWTVRHALILSNGPLNRLLLQGCDLISC